ncbi:MAG: helix-turn-helix domain-containing protein, partial [Lentisphaerae bacterium]|nr:helix-turn-helix domain-containing protein [Lentisphaerota bacterium]
MKRLDSGENSGFSLSQLAHAAGLKMPTARSILQTLIELDMVSQDSRTRLYSLGPSALRMGRGQWLFTKLIRASAPILKRLRDASGETVLLAVYDGGFRNTLISFESEELVHVGVHEGRDTVFYGSATGRVLLSLLPEEEAETLIHRMGLPEPGVWPGVEDAKGLRKALDHIRQTKGCRLDRPLKQ